MSEKLIIPQTQAIKHVKDSVAKQMLIQLCWALDEMEVDDTFGTEGWRKGVLGQDA